MRPHPGRSVISAKSGWSDAYGRPPFSRFRTSKTGGIVNEGELIVITAPVTETIDHAGYFIQMAMASLPIWLEKILDSKYLEPWNIACCFASALPEKWMAAMGKIYVGKPLDVKTRRQLLETVKPQHLRYLRAGNGD